MREQLLYRQMREALAVACAATGLDAVGAELMRVHSNSVFHLPAENAVARIATSPDAAEGVSASLEVTQQLWESGFPTVKPKVNRVIRHCDLAVSFWVYEQSVPGPRPFQVLAALLRKLHSLENVSFDLPAIRSPLEGVAHATADHPEAFDGEDQAWLADEITACDQRWAGMDFALARGLIHGDSHPNNVLNTVRGPLLCDWDHVAMGPREWDLVHSLYFHRRFPRPEDDLDAAAAAYGWDLRDWRGAADLVAVREVFGLGAYIRTAAAKPQARVELAHRIATLRDGDTDALWNSPAAS
jgi:Phosphotransferase enzyme family